jgi:hypothetical protein
LEQGEKSENLKNQIIFLSFLNLQTGTFTAVLLSRVCGWKNGASITAI